MTCHFAVRASVLALAFAGAAARAQDAAASSATPQAPGTPVASAPQDQPPAATTGVGDIIVTARRTQERLQDVPLAVTALSSQALEQRNITNLRSLGSAVPGLAVAEANSPTTLIVTIRGLANTNPNTGSDAAVGFYFNEVPINLQNGTNIGMFDLEGVQVLKGPQGTLFGRNTTGGAVLVNAQKPTDRLEGHVQAGGTFFRIGQGFQGEAVANLPVAKDFAVRAGVSIVDRDGWVRNLKPPVDPASYGVPFPFGPSTGENEGYQRSQAWRVGARWTPAGSGFENLTFYDGSHVRTTSLSAAPSALNPTGAIVQFAPFLGYPDPVALYQELLAAKKDYYWTTIGVSNNPLTLNTTTLSNTTSYQLSDLLTLKNIAGYRTVKETYGQDIVGLGTPYYTYKLSTGGRNISDELQLQGHTADKRLTWVTGLFYFQERRFNYFTDAFAFSAPSAGTDYVSHSRSYSAFGQGTLKLGAVSLTGGLRYNIDHRSARLTRVVPAYNGAPATCVFPGVTLADCLLTAGKTFRALSYTASADYKADANTLLYVTTRRGYRAGGFSTTQTNAANGYIGFAPEKLTDYELGLKRDWSFGDVRVRTNLAVFHQIYDDIQRLAIDPNDFTNQIIINASNAKVNGGEAEVTVSPVRGLTLTYGYARVDPKYGRFVLGGIDYSSNTFGYSSKNTHDASVTVELPVAEATGRISLAANYHHQSRFFYDDLIQDSQSAVYPPRTLGQRGYGVLGANASWNGIFRTNFDLELFATNLTNTKIVPNGSPSTYPTLGAGAAFYGGVLPRMIGFNLRYRFGG